MRNVVMLTATIAVGATVLTARAQAPSPAPAFEVASVRANTAFGNQSLQIGPEQFTATNQSLSLFILLAHGINGAQLVGAPDWIDSARFDIRAKSSGPATRAELLGMLRTLLAERFRLQVRSEDREMDGYSLVPARTDRSLGKGLAAVTIDCVANRLLDDSRPGLFPADTRRPCETNTSHMRMNAGPVLVTWQSTAVTMEGLARTLYGMLGRPVVDQTGLTGRYDVELQYIRDMPPGIGPTAPTPPEGPALVDAIKEQLGLQLKAERVPTTVLIVESIQRPSVDEN